MLDSIGHNLILARELRAFVSSADRPMLAGAVRESKAIPVDVRVRLARDEAVPPAETISGPGPVPGLRPVGTLLDCYM